MLKSLDPRPCKEYWIQALTPTSASVAPTLSSTLLTGMSSGMEVVYTAYRFIENRQRDVFSGMKWHYEKLLKHCQWLHLHLANSMWYESKASKSTCHFVIVFNHHCGCIFPIKSVIYLVMAHLVTNGVVVISVYHCYFHCCLGHKKSIAGSDIEDVEVAFLSVQEPLHIHLPFTLNQAQCKHTTIVTTWTTQRQISRRVRTILDVVCYWYPNKFLITIQYSTVYT